jgi:hypothetical protein
MGISIYQHHQKDVCILQDSKTKLEHLELIGLLPLFDVEQVCRDLDCLGLDGGGEVIKSRLASYLTDRKAEFDRYTNEAIGKLWRSR